MKFLKKLLGAREPERPTWNIPPAQERPAPRDHQSAAEAPESLAKKPDNPFLDDNFDEMEIVNDVAPASADPYASNKWKIDQEDATSKLKALEIGKLADAEGEDFDPYDTGIFRRGWKD